MMLEPETEFDKVERRIEISATIAEGVAEAFEKTKALHGGLSGHRQRYSGGPIRPSERRAGGAEIRVAA
jgi:hypothetical protein